MPTDRASTTPMRPATAGAVTVLWIWVLVALGVDWWSGQVWPEWFELRQPTPPLGQVQIWAYATRNVFALVLVVLCFALPVGAVVGGVAAYGPRGIRALLGRTVELSGALPSLIIVGLFRLGTGGASLLSLGLVLAGLSTVEVSRLVSEETARINRETYILAAQALGGSKRHIFTFHILPQLLPQLGVKSMMVTGSVILLEAALSFVGLGVNVAASVPRPQNVTWGSLLGEFARSDGPPELAASLAAVSILVTGLSLYWLAPRGGPATDASGTAA